MKSNSIKVIFSLLLKSTNFIWPILVVGFCVFLIFKGRYPEAIVNMFFFMMLELMTIRKIVEESAAEKLREVRVKIIECEGPTVL